MPELPEMRALAERVDAELAGLDLRSWQALSFAGLKTVQPSPDELVGRCLEAVTSRGKYLVWLFAGGARLLVHLWNAGRLDLERPPKETRPKGSVARWDLGEAGALLREHGPRRGAGWWVLGPGQDGPLGELGPEPGDQAFAELVLHGADRRQLHTLLRDQRTVAGIGRGYADDSLNRAGLSPFASLDSLHADAREQLLESVRSVLEEALASERRRTGGLSDAKLGDRFAVHRRAGLPCPRCGTTLERISYASYEVVYCPTCQTGGRVLADRRLSRLLR